MKRIYNIAMIGAIAAGTLFTACSEDFLKPDPLSMYEPGNTFTTESGIRAALANSDRSLRNYVTYYEAANLVTPFYTMYLHTDLAVAGKTDQSTIWADPAKRLTPTNGMEGGGSEVNQLGYYWSESYEGIKSANTIISYLPNVEMDESAKNAYLGRAYFHRSFRYLHLVFMFKDVPFITKLVNSPKFDFRSTSREAILQKLMADMEFAVQWVPDQKDMSEIGLINKGACRMLLAKIYLATGQWQKAIEQTSALIDDPNYDLMRNTFGAFVEPFNNEAWHVTRNVIWDLHRAENKLISANKEVIFGMPNRGVGSSNSFVSFYTMRALGALWNSGNIVTPDGKKAIEAYSRTNANYGSEYDYRRALGRGTGYLRPTYYFQHSMWNVNGQEDMGDLRHSAEAGNWVETAMLKVNNKASQYFGQQVQKAWAKDTIRDWYGWPHYKIYLQDHSAEANASATQFNGASSSSTTDGCADWYLYRLAEAYLLRAEAKFYNGDPTGAAQDVNQVRQRAQCAQLYSTVTIGDIMAERARELYLEEWRYPEMSRVSYCLALSGKPDEWGNTYDVATYDKQEGTDENGGSYWYQRLVHYNDFYNKNPNLIIRNHIYTIDKHNLYLPIPQSAIDANRNGKLRQNFGYDGYDETIPMWETWEEAVAAE